MIMLMLGHLEVQSGVLQVQSGALASSEWGTCRLRVGHLQAQYDFDNNDNANAGALGGSEWGTWRPRVGHLEAQSGPLAG